MSRTLGVVVAVAFAATAMTTLFATTASAAESESATTAPAVVAPQGDLGWVVAPTSGGGMHTDGDLGW
ncbi:hypothetical protein [Actinacidiphila sp. bgisy160]|uniref:hypothetical protein n=1 Tax=Actinacidiphila sp. bgisy160 TaxID=3413796 RepID=UPI003D74DBA8